MARRPAKENSPSSPIHGRPRWAAVLMAIVLVAAVVLAFWPSLWNGFNYDDETNVVRNMRFRGLGAEQLAWMFTTFKAGHYQPLSWMSLGLDYVIWGERPFGYHLTNLVLHAANAVLVFWLARRLIAASQSPTPEGWGTLAGAGIAALVFAVHPLRVESVAWVTERRDVLSSFFLLATVLLYLRAMRCDTHRSYIAWMAAAVVVFALSLLSRAMGVTLPVILLILDWHPLRRFKGSGLLSSKRSPAPRPRRHPQVQTLAERTVLTPGILAAKIPFVLLAVAAAAVAPLAQKSVGAAAMLEHHGVPERIAQACYGLLFYVWKTVAPWGLVPMHELRTPLQILSPKYVVSILAVMGAALLLTLFARRWRGLAAAAACYLVLLSPVLGFVQSGQQEVADRYSYLPAVVIAILLGGGIAKLLEHPATRSAGAVAVAVSCAIGLALGALTWRQCAVWRDAESLWTHAIAAGPPAATAHYNLGSVYGQQGRTRDAQAHFIRALEINPRYPDAYYNLGNTYTQLGNLERAERAYLGCVQINREHVTAWYHLGNALARQGKTEPAIEAYKQAVRLRPGYIEAWVNLGTQFWKQDAREEAIAAYREAVRVGPNHADARANLGGALAALGRHQQALVELREAVRLDPDRPELLRQLQALEAHLRGN